MEEPSRMAVTKWSSYFIASSIVGSIDKRSIKMLTMSIVGNFHSLIVQFHELI